MAKANEEDKDRTIPIIIIGGLAAVLAWIFFRGRAQADPDKAILYGQLTEAGTGTPIRDINVDCDGYTAKTNSEGDYRIINIEPGTYSISFTDPLGRYAPLVV